MADVVLPATMFLEHADIYSGGGHQYVEFADKLIDAPGECRTNHDVICAIAKRVGVTHPSFDMSARDLAAITLRESGLPALEELERRSWIDVQPDFETSHFLKGFAWPNGKYRFKPDWPSTPFGNIGLQGPWRSLPAFPDHWDVLENADEAHPFRLATSPARSFLNSTFNETPSSRAREGRPEVMVHPEDARRLGIAEGDEVSLGNGRGDVRLHARYFEGLQEGVLISEGLWPNSAFTEGKGINTLTSAESPAPFGGAAFHDNKVWLKRVDS